MSVSTYDPHQAFTITPDAHDHLTRQLQASGARWLRLGVKESGCNGFMYSLDYVANPESEDLTYTRDGGLNIVVRKSELALIQGTEIDFVTEGLNSALRFRNPNADSHCGCGESFSLKH